MMDFGSLATWLTLALLISAFVVFLRGGGGVALGHLRDANVVLADTIKAQETKLSIAEREISELRGRTDVSIAIAQALGPIIEWSQSHEDRAQERHAKTEARAQDRHDKTMVILDLIATRLLHEEVSGIVRTAEKGATQT